MEPNQKIMQEFTLKTIPNLDVCVLAALELFSQTKIPQIKIPFKRSLVVGSGNAAATGKILFEKADAIFADESTVDIKLKNIKSIDGVVLISASGAKHAPIIAKKAKAKNKKVILLTNTLNSMGSKHADQTYVFPKNREPYTYNTSTYMGPIFGYTHEDPKAIHRYIKTKIDKIKLPNFKKYSRFYFIVPEEFTGIIRLLNVKFIELFGRRVSRDIETFEYMKHATTIVPSPNELFIDFSPDKRKNTKYGEKEHRIHIPLPKNADYGAMMAIGYYIVGKIQAQKPAWFKKNLQAYMQRVSKEYGYNIPAIVE
tara:strand:+ start:472 stop:1407 length:936 start_codon:yes stop_codon:yes gene_type:complete